MKNQNSAKKNPSHKYDLVASLIGGPEANSDYQRTMNTTDGFQNSFTKKSHALTSYENTHDDEEILVRNASGANGKSQFL